MRRHPFSAIGPRALLDDGWSLQAQIGHDRCLGRHHRSHSRSHRSLGVAGARRRAGLRPCCVFQIRRPPGEGVPPGCEATLC